MASRRPSIASPCVADRAHAAGERIAEFSAPSIDEAGGLLSLREEVTAPGRGTLVLNLYRLENVRVHVDAAALGPMSLRAAAKLWAEQNGVTLPEPLGRPADRALDHLRRRARPCTPTPTRALDHLRREAQGAPVYAYADARGVAFGASVAQALDCARANGYGPPVYSPLGYDVEPSTWADAHGDPCTTFVASQGGARAPDDYATRAAATLACWTHAMGEGWPAA